MLASFMDIKTRIKEAPKWFDSNGVPRYGKFHPDLCPNIYADEMVLLEIACQDCGRRFLVEMNWDKFGSFLRGGKIPSFRKRLMEWKKLSDEKKKEEWSPIHYGDPPIHGCVGDTMNVYDLRLVQLWARSKKFPWTMTRRRRLEIELMSKDWFV